MKLNMNRQKLDDFIDGLIEKGYDRAGDVPLDETVKFWQLSFNAGYWEYNYHEHTRFVRIDESIYNLKMLIKYTLLKIQQDHCNDR